MRTTNEQRRNGRKWWKIVLTIVFILLGIALYEVLPWSRTMFGKVPFEQVVFHVIVPLEGTDSSLLKSFLSNLYQDFVIAAGIAVLLFLPEVIRVIYSITERLLNKKTEKKSIDAIEDKENGIWHRGLSLVKKCRRWIVHHMLLISFVGLLAVLSYDVKEFGVITWIKNRMQSSTIYEDYYVSPPEVAITAPAKKKNLILITSESLEATYADKENGGACEENLIPELTKLAKENIHFSSKDNLQGGMEVIGTGWTIAALVANTAGIPLDLPLAEHELNRMKQYLPHVVTLGEILEQEGYYNELILGSGKSFTGKDKYFTQHGNYEIIDFFAAMEQGYVEDSNGFWGMDDATVFSIAKEKVSLAAQKDQPFHILIETVDLHNPTGYVCSQCESTYADSIGGNLGEYMDIIRCQDRQIAAFVRWCQSQDFYEDTVIVIVGDHTSMAPVVEESMAPEGYERTVYNVIINSDVTPASKENRAFATMDMFPTILTSIGFQIEGDRLGIGTNLFSGKMTIAEEIGAQKFQKEIAKNSKRYNKEIISTK